MKISLKLDNREGKLKELFEEEKISVVYENLAHGDIQILADDVIIFLFERKTISDLIASIKDGRYKNQKYMLDQSGFTTDQIFYIIEGSVKWESTSSVNKSVNGAIINTLIRDKIGIFHTKDIATTFSLIKNIFDRVSKDPEKYLSRSTERQIVTLSINDKTTPDKCFINMLCQIPTISEKTATAIKNKFGSMKDLISEMTDKTKEEQEKVLSTVKIVDDSGKQRKISSKCIENLINYLF